MGTRDLTTEETAESQRLKAIFEAKKKALGISQQTTGDSMGISQAAVGHYLNGRNPLNLNAAHHFAEILNCSIKDFSPRLAAEATRYMVREETSTYSNLEAAAQPPQTRLAPIVSSITAGNWGSAADIHPVGHGEDYEPVPAGASAHSFWMRVKGDSMVSPIPAADSFPPGTLVHVEPEMQWEYGDYVVAKLDDSEEATFKQIVEDAGKKYLKPLNNAYGLIAINGNCRIVGKVTEYKRKL